MTGQRPTYARNLGIVALLLVVAGNTIIVAIITRADYANARNVSREELLFNVTLSATRLDSILRAAANKLDSFAEGKDVGEALHDASFGIPEAANVYVLDERGHVVSSAYSRNQPIVAIDPIIMERLRAGALTEYRILDVPGEGGATLAMIRRIRRDTAKPHFIAAVFSAQSIQGSLILLTSKAYASARLIDPDGNFLDLGDRPAAGKAEGIEVSLSDAPLRLRFEADAGAVMAPWRRRTAAIVSIVAALTLVIAGLLIYAILLWKRRLTAEEMRRELERKDTLFREVNHRIKNNLAIVQTILDFGAQRIREYPESATQTLESAIDRVRAIASLHELLYKVPPSERDDLGIYIQSLANAVREAYGCYGRITVLTRIDGGLTFALEKMVPIALIINELLTNAFKYAFPDNRSGVIEIGAKRGDDGSMALIVSDDGIGLSDHRAPNGGIGTFLVETLASQLGASVDISARRPSGISCTVVMPPEPLAIDGTRGSMPS